MLILLTDQEPSFRREHNPRPKKESKHYIIWQLAFSIFLLFFPVLIFGSLLQK